MTGVGVDSSSMIDEVGNSFGGYDDVYNKDDDDDNNELSLSFIVGNDSSVWLLNIANVLDNCENLFHTRMNWFLDCLSKNRCHRVYPMVMNEVFQTDVLARFQFRRIFLYHL